MVELRHFGTNLEELIIDPDFMFYEWDDHLFGFVDGLHIRLAELVSVYDEAYNIWKATKDSAISCTGQFLGYKYSMCLTDECDFEAFVGPLKDGTDELLSKRSGFLFLGGAIIQKAQ